MSRSIDDIWTMCAKQIVVMQSQLLCGSGSNYRMISPPEIALGLFETCIWKSRGWNGLPNKYTTFSSVEFSRAIDVKCR